MTEYIYGYGATKHIAGTEGTSDDYRGQPALCGAYGGFPIAQPERPVCKRCAKQAAKVPGSSSVGEGLSSNG